jgi:hypothetical protein
MSVAEKAERIRTLVVSFPFIISFFFFLFLFGILIIPLFFLSFLIFCTWRFNEHNKSIQTTKLASNSPAFMRRPGKTYLSTFSPQTTEDPARHPNAGSEGGWLTRPAVFHHHAHHEQVEPAGGGGHGVCGTSHPNAVLCCCCLSGSPLARAPKTPQESKTVRPTNMAPASNNN